MTKRSPITTHILDTSRGRPAAGVPVRLERGGDDGWTELALGATDDDGRVGDLLPPGPIEPGTYRISFDTDAYYAEMGGECFYPVVSIAFTIRASDEHYHVPLLLNPFGFSTYRGS